MKLLLQIANLSARDSFHIGTFLYVLTMDSKYLDGMSNVRTKLCGEGDYFGRLRGDAVAELNCALSKLGSCWLGWTDTTLCASSRVWTDGITWFLALAIVGLLHEIVSVAVVLQDCCHQQFVAVFP